MINSSISEQDFQEYSELIEQGYSQRSACEVLSLSRSSVQRYIKKLNELNIDITVGNVVDKVVNKPKVLFYDIETLPNISAHFGNWNENLPYKQRIQESCLLSHSWCWGDGEI
ncbi:helix-turn-helix domain-containing protein, partial [Xanthomonas citri pv. citri]